MQTQSRHDDTKLLLTIAAVIVTGAAGIALIAGIGDEPTAVPERKVVRAPTNSRTSTPPPAMPASQQVSTPTLTPTAPPSPAITADPEIELAANREPEVDDDTTEDFSFAPGENLVTGGLVAWEARDFPRAAAYFEAQVEARDTDAWSHYMLGLARWKNGELDAAAVAMRTSCELDASSVKARVNLARIENDRGDFVAALAATDEALTIFPAHPKALFLRARSLYNSGQVEAAVGAIEASLAGDSDNGYAHNLLGLIRIEQESFDAATDALEIAARLEPDVTFIQNNHGMALERVAERDAALVAYRRAVELDPQNARALRNLARLEPGSVPIESEVALTEDVSEIVVDVVEVEEGPVEPSDAGGFD